MVIIQQFTSLLCTIQNNILTDSHLAPVLLLRTICVMYVPSHNTRLRWLPFRESSLSDSKACINFQVHRIMSFNISTPTFRKACREEMVILTSWSCSTLEKCLDIFPQAEFLHGNSLNNVWTSFSQQCYELNFLPWLCFETGTHIDDGLVLTVLWIILPSSRRIGVSVWKAE